MDKQNEFELTPILALENIHSNVKCSSKKRALELISQMAAEKLQVPAQEVFEALLSRERLGCTNIGAGVVVPHCQLDYDFSTFIIMLQLQKSIDFDCIDNNPVDLIFALIFPRNNEETHSQILHTVLEKLSDKALIKLLKNAKTDEELYQLISA